MIVTKTVTFHPLMQSVEFSPNGELLASSKYHEFLGSAQHMFELLLIRSPDGKIQKSFSRSRMTETTSVIGLLEPVLLC